MRTVTCGNNVPGTNRYHRVHIHRTPWIKWRPAHTRLDAGSTPIMWTRWYCHTVRSHQANTRRTQEPPHPARAQVVAKNRSEYGKYNWPWKISRNAHRLAQGNIRFHISIAIPINFKNRSPTMFAVCLAYLSDNHIHSWFKRSPHSQHSICMDGDR